MLVRQFAMVAAMLFAIFSGLSAQETTVKIVYVSKMPDIEAPLTGMAGLPELATLVSTTRSSSPNVLFLHGGDSLAPSAMSVFDHGIHMIDILNGIRPDAMAIGEREFCYKEDELILRAREASFPFICSNIVDPLVGGNLPGVKDVMLFDRGGYRIGVFSILDPMVLETYLPDRIRIKDYAKTVTDCARTLRNSGADIVILLSGKEGETVDRILADGTVDIVIENSHEDAIYVKNRGVLVRQGAPESNAVMLDLNLERSGGAVRARYEGRIVPLGKYPPDKQISLRIAEYLDTLDSFMKVTVGTTETRLDTTTAALRTSENAFGNLVADAVRSYYGAEIGLVNSGSIRGNRIYPAGTALTRKDLQTELSFNNQSRFVSVTGAQLRSALENAFSQLETEKGRFLQVSGIQVRYRPGAPVGKRVRSVLVGRKPLKDDQRYTLATSDFIVRGGDGFDVLKNAKAVRTNRSSLLVWEIVRFYIEQHKRVNPRIEGRLIAENK